MNGYDELFQSVKEIAQSLQALNRRAVREYTPIVEAIVREGCRDVQHIERTLDGLLDFAHDPAALLLYKKLCRHYYSIDPAATARYIEYYREMWNSESEEQS